MKKVSFEGAIAQIRSTDRRYDEEAYRFIREALDYTVDWCAKPDAGAARHVSGHELLEGVRRFALQEFGAIAFRVLDHWGVRRTEDVGEIVFNLVATGVLGRTEQDRREDFAGGYDFDEAFRAPFRSASARQPAGEQTES